MKRLNFDGIEILSTDVSLEKEQEVRLNNRRSFKYGVDYLDCATGGIVEGDLVIFGAYSGLGKTELATRIAQVNAEKGVNVVMLALESKTHEIIQRIKYRRMAELFYQRELNVKYGFNLRYRPWLRGEYETELFELNTEVNNELNKKLGSLQVIYREYGDFTAQHLVELVEQLAGNYLTDPSIPKCELLIIDHIHLFDLDGFNENLGVKKLMKTLRDITILKKLPIVAISHLRKKEKGDTSIMPTMDDLHGSSDIAKIGYTVITMAGYNPKDAEPEEFIYPTLFRVSKDRTEGGVARFVGLQKYDARVNKYQDEVIIGRYQEWGKEFVPLEEYDYPYWAESIAIKNRKKKSSPSVGNIYV